MVSNGLSCGSYKTMSDDEGTFIQVKLNDSENVTPIVIAQVEQEKTM